MKLDWTKKKVERSTEFNEKHFSIGDVSVIMTILRSKLYSNAIKAFTQELMSNARDAHREVGKGDIPIEVKLPSSLDRTFYVRDFGPGISPERMENVFIRYGCSTKRENDEQTGGFGIGAKSPWSYSDMFCIATVTPDDEGKMILRNYVALIGENQTGQLDLVSEEETDEPQGTMIIVSCKPNDESSFSSWVKNATQFWPVRPIIKGVQNFKWDEVAKTFEGNKWFLNVGNRYSYNREKPKAIVDGIPYPLNWENLEMDKLPKEAKDICDKLFNHSVYLEFETGEVSLTANREEIDYTPKSISEIQKRLTVLAKELAKQISEGIKNAKNLWDANLMWNKTDNNLRSLIGESAWKGHKVTGSSPAVDSKSGINLFHFQRQWNSSTDFRKRTNYNSARFTVREDNMLFVNDESNAVPNRRRLVTIFTKFPNINDVYIYHLPTEDEVVQDGAVNKNARKVAKKALEDANIDLYNPSKMTDYDKAPIVRKQKAANGTVTTVDYKVPKIWKFNASGDNKRSAWDSNTTFSYTTEKGYYVLLKSREATGSIDNKSWPICALAQAELMLTTAGVANPTIWGVAEKLSDKISSNLIPLETGIESVYKSLANDADVKKFATIDLESRDIPEQKLACVWSHIKQTWKNKINDKNGVMWNYLETSETIVGVSDKIKNFQRAEALKQGVRPNSHYELTAFFKKQQKNVQTPYTELKKLSDEAFKVYPLLSYVNQWMFERNKHEEALFDYINMVDEKMARLKKAATVPQVVTVP